MSDQPETTSTATATATKSSPRPKRRWFRYLLVFMILAGVGVYYLPQIIASTALKNQIINAVQGDFAGTIEIGSAKLDWTNAMSVQDVTLRPKNKSESVLTIASIESEQSLLDLFSLGDQGLKLTIRGPQLDLIVTEQGTNIDELLPKVPEKDKDATGFDPIAELKNLENLLGTLPIGTLTMVDGLIRIDDQPNATKYSIESLKAVLKRTNTPKALGIDVTGTVVVPDTDPQSISLKGLVDADTHKGEVTTEFPKLTSGIIMPLLESSLPGWKLKSSAVQPGFKLNWDLASTKPTLDLDATLTLDQATLANDEILAGQRLFFERGAVVVKSHPSADLKAWDLQADVALQSPTLYQMKTNAAGVTEPEVLWQEKAPWIQVVGAYENTADLIRITKAEVKSMAAQGAVAGTVKELSHAAVVDLKGTMTVDFQQFSPALLGLDDQSVRLGKFTTQDFELSGPIFPEKTGTSSTPAATELNSSTPAVNGSPAQPASITNATQLLSQLKSQSTISWDQMAAYGVYSQQGSLNAKLSEGRLEVSPITVPVNGGQWLAPVSVDLKSDPPVAYVAKSRVFDNVQFSEEMARLWLKFVNPLLADSTGIEGMFSLDLAQAVIPIGQLQQANIQGQIDVHNGRIGPGPLMQQVMSPAGMFGALAPKLAQAGDPNTKWLDMQPQKVPFAVQQGRVYHKDIQYKMGKALLSTSGSVGIDQTLDIVIDVPVGEMIGSNKPVLAALAQGGIKIPVHGTMARPIPDFSAAGQMGKEFGMKAADGLINELVNPGGGGTGGSGFGDLLNGLIDRKKKKTEGK